MNAMMAVKHDSVALWNRVAVVSSIERRELKEILLFFFFLFGGENSSISYFLAIVIHIFLFYKRHLSLDTLFLYKI